MVLNDIQEQSRKTLAEIQEKMKIAFPDREDRYKEICVYACGSLGRLEMTEHSDLDLFFVSVHEGKGDPMEQKLNQYLFFSKLYDINNEMKFSDPSKGGEYWSFINRADLLDIGSRKEDFNNSFTTRLLLILESKPIYNVTAYEDLVRSTIEEYFRDYDEHKDAFYPLFLMNDILRYWYTLTLNYEYRRDSSDSDEKKNWKRLTLKYARLATCFSMLACLYHPNITPEYVIECIKMTPFERFSRVAEENEAVLGIVDEIRKEYEWFLDLRGQGNTGFNKEGNLQEAFRRADRFHELVVHNLMGELSKGNPELRSKADFY